MTLDDIYGFLNLYLITNCFISVFSDNIDVVIPVKEAFCSESDDQTFFLFHPWSGPLESWTREVHCFTNWFY